MKNRWLSIPPSPFVLLAALLLLGLAARCRLYFYGASYWYDEAYLLLNVFGKSAGELLGPLGNDQAVPPLFLLLLRGLYVAAGAGEWVLRLPAFVSTLLALALMVPLARRVVGRHGWLWAVGLAAVCQHAVAHGCQVKPYAGDLLLAEVVILGAALLLRPEVQLRGTAGQGTSPKRQRGEYAAAPLAGASGLCPTGLRGRAAGCLLLLGAAALGPWLSYPSVFCLGAASVALLIEFGRRRERALGWTWVGLSIFTTISGASLWFFVARHHHTSSLQAWWASFFPDVSSPWAALRWGVGYLIEVGHYGATGLGVPLLGLALAGWVVLARRSPALLALLTLPLGLAWVAGVARVYPLGDRLLFFAAPCLWLAAAAGAGALVQWCGERRRALAWTAMSAGLLLPGAARIVKDLGVRPVVVEFREAFAYVHAHRQPGDVLWVSHPQVYEVYHGRPAWLLGAYTPVARVEEAARRSRLWMVFTPQTPGLTLFPEVFARVQAAGAVPVQRHQVQGLEIVLYERTNADLLRREPSPPSQPSPQGPATPITAAGCSCPGRHGE
jgi:hypothetical protein